MKFNDLVEALRQCIWCDEWVRGEILWQDIEKPFYCSTCIDLRGVQDMPREAYLDWARDKGPTVEPETTEDVARKTLGKDWRLAKGWSYGDPTSSGV